MSLFDAFLEDCMEESNLDAESAPRKEVWFAIRSDGAKGTGTREDPYNGTEVIVDDPLSLYDLLRFDLLIRSVPENCVIHLGPGIFATGGGDTGNRPRTPWQPKAGQKIVGAGMFQTTLKLMLWADPDTNDPDRAFPAIGIDQAANFSSYEVSDLTIDCNLLGQPNSTGLGYPKITVSGIALYGTNIKVRRVRIINWGRRAATKECFPLYLSESIPGGAYDSGVPQYAAELMSSVVEDCIVEQPDWNRGDLGNGGGETTAIVAPVVRNCVVRGDLVRPGPFPKIPLLQLSHTYTNPTYTVTIECPFAHQMKTGERIFVSGVLVGGVLSSVLNGAFSISAVPTLKSLQYTVASDPGAGTISGTMTVEKESKPTLLVKSLEWAGGVARLETYEPHRRLYDEWVVVSGVTDANNLDSSLYNGSFKVIWADATHLECAVASDPGTANGQIWLDRVTRYYVPITAVSVVTISQQKYMQVTVPAPHYRLPNDWVHIWSGQSANSDGYHQVESLNLTSTQFLVKWTSANDPVGVNTSIVVLNHTQAIGGNGRIIENNQVWHCFRGVFHDTWTMMDLVIRQNYFYSVFFPVYRTMGESDSVYVGEAPRHGIAEYNVVTAMVTVNTDAQHGLKDGALVQIVQEGGSAYNGVYRIHVVDAATFEYTPGSNPGDAAWVDIIEFFQCFRSIISENLCELPFRPTVLSQQGEADLQRPRLIGFTLQADGYQYATLPMNYLVHNSWVRGNFIRHIDGAAGSPDDKSVGIGFRGASGALLRSNIVECELDWLSMPVRLSEKLKTVQNTRSDGGRLNASAVNTDTTAKLSQYPDFADDADDGLLGM